MLKFIFLIAILTLPQTGCYTEEETGFYKPAEFSPESLERLEQLKRDSLKIEDLKMGDGSIAALGRKVTANIEARYPDGTLVYSGPAISYFGMQGYVFIHDSVTENGILSSQQRGIMLGLNGMAVGGKRRITVPPKLVCEGFGGEQANPNISCILVSQNRLNGGNVIVRKEKLIVDATLTASCIPVFIDIPYIYHGEFRCRNADGPQRDPSDPIWRVY